MFSRMGRGLLEFLLILVLLFFAASLLGLLGSSRRGEDQPEQAGDRADTRVFPALLTEIEEFGRRRQEDRDSAERPVLPQTPVRIYVSNGCGVNKLAARMRDLLREEGFDVCGISNADCSDYAQTVVIDRCGERGKAHAVLAYLQRRFGVGRRVLQVRKSPEADVLIVLGSDLAARLAQEHAPER